jgi:type VI secretion system protein ImpB
MAKRESTQHVLDRVRKPRVHITYDVETGGAIEMKELPFVVGVLADLTGQPVVDDEGKKIRVKDRKFVRIDRDNFHDVLGGMKPAVNLRVANRLSAEEGAQMNVALKFKNLSDFDPEQVVNQVEPLRKLLDARRRLSDLKGKLDGNDKLDELLTKVLSNPVELGKLKDAIGVTPPAEGDAGGSKSDPTEGSNE